MTKFKCKLESDNCKKCGECCIFDKSVKLTKLEESTLKESIYRQTGFIYLYEFKNFGLGLQSYEFDRARMLARKHKIRLDLLPKKVIYDYKENKTIVFDWFLNHKRCPFLQKKNHCVIYKDRFDICRAFPETGKVIPTVEDRHKNLEAFIAEGKISPAKDIEYEKAVLLAKKAPLINFEVYLVTAQNII
jgi:Fe-S-cluster containining protein